MIYTVHIVVDNTAVSHFNPDFTCQSALSGITNDPCIDSSVPFIIKAVDNRCASSSMAAYLIWSKIRFIYFNLPAKLSVLFTFLSHSDTKLDENIADLQDRDSAQSRDVRPKKYQRKITSNLSTYLNCDLKIFVISVFTNHFRSQTLLRKCIIS